MIEWRSCLTCGMLFYLKGYMCSDQNARTAVVLGILYLSFQAYPFIFEREHQFNTQSSGMSFLGIGLGMILGISTQPFWNRYNSLVWLKRSLIICFCRFYKKESQKNAGRVPPESRLVMGEVGAVLIPIGTYTSVVTNITTSQPLGQEWQVSFGLPLQPTRRCHGLYQS